MPGQSNINCFQYKYKTYDFQELFQNIVHRYLKCRSYLISVTVYANNKHIILIRLEDSLNRIKFLHIPLCISNLVI